MSAVADALQIIATSLMGVWLGKITFFSFVAAPTTFRAVDKDVAGEVVNSIFPKYYSIGAGLGAAALATTTLHGYLDGYSTPVIATMVGCVVGFVIDLYARYGLIPRMEKAGDEEFGKLHKLSVMLNGVVILSTLTALIASQL